MTKPYKLGYVQGTFDMFHVGHLILLERAYARCEKLLVGVVSDALNEKYKGAKPYIPFEDRARIVEALKVVDKVICVDFANEDKLKIWDEYHYDCHFSGDDHKGWDYLKGELEKRGSTIELFPYTQRVSSTKLKDGLRLKAIYGRTALFPYQQLPERVAIYGAGRFGLQLYRMLQEVKNVRVVAWADKGLAGEELEGRRLLSPGELANVDFDQVVVAVLNQSVAEEIRGELQQLGISEEKILWVDMSQRK